ncbi:Inner membrane ABC transporter permease protein YnjC [bacterium HR40]|nr:Inner membrane ABC transporter permease protein YnjC [bacterium HR40]
MTASPESKAVSIAVLLLAIPALAGLVATLLPAFGVAPGFGAYGPDLAPWRRLLAEPGLPRALLSGTGAGLASTILAVLAAHFILAHLHLSGRLVRLAHGIAPLLALPHAVFAIGFAFLVQPSGLLLRLISPWATGFEQPPDWRFPGDPWTISLTLGLALRETPFLLLAGLAVLARMPTATYLAVARSLGHQWGRAWLAVVLPPLQRALRLPALAVLAYGCSAVDMALVLGPSTPPTLAVLVARLAVEPAPELRHAAAAGAVLQLLAILLAAAVFLFLERLLLRLVARRSRSSRRGKGEGRVWASGVAMTIVPGTGLLVLSQLLLWSLAGSWRFPALLPDALTFEHWRRASPQLVPAATTSLLLALPVAAVAVAAAVPLLRRRDATGHYGRLPAASALLWLPLVLPQLAFLPGFQFLALVCGIDGTLTAVALAHFVFVLPYVLLVAAGPFAAMPDRYGEVARLLGSRPIGAFLRAEAPLLLRPLAVAFAVGASVSMALYLPTLLLGGGRVATLSTETIAFTLSGDRRLAAATGLLFAVLPGLLFLVPFLFGAPGGKARRAAHRPRSL